MIDGRCDCLGCVTWRLAVRLCAVAIVVLLAVGLIHSCEPKPLLIDAVPAASDPCAPLAPPAKNKPRLYHPWEPVIDRKSDHRAQS